MHAEPEPPIDVRELERRARSAYERGRLRAAIGNAWPVLGLTAIALALGSRPWSIIAVASVLLVVVVAALHRGRGPGRVVPSAWLGGSLPLLAGLLSCRVPHTCAGSDCTSGCLVVCLVAAALGGAFVARRSAALAPGDREALLTAGLVAALTGSLGCIVIGAAGLSGLALGLAVVAVPALVVARAR
jgi:hypothetical protein